MSAEIMPKSRIFSQDVPFHAISPAVFFPATQHFVPAFILFCGGFRTLGSDVRRICHGVRTSSAGFSDFNPGWHR